MNRFEDAIRQAQKRRLEMEKKPDLIAIIKKRNSKVVQARSWEYVLVKEVQIQIKMLAESWGMTEIDACVSMGLKPRFYLQITKSKELFFRTLYGPQLLKYMNSDILYKGPRRPK